jgi:hypothetical protein
MEQTRTSHSTTRYLSALNNTSPLAAEKALQLQAALFITQVIDSHDLEVYDSQVLMAFENRVGRYRCLHASFVTAP